MGRHRSRLRGKPTETIRDPDTGRILQRLERAITGVAFVAIALLAGLFTVHRFDDLDICWHLRTGQWILSEGRIPHTDPFAGGTVVPSWVDFEWGSQVIAAIAVKLGGLAGLQLLVAGLVVATLLIFFFSAPRSPTLLLAGLCFTLTAWQRFLIRPDILCLPMLLIAMAWIDRIPRATRSTPILLAMLTAVMVNLHGSFILIPTLVAAASFGALLSRREPAILLAHGRALVLCCLAALLNPYGYQIYVLFAPYLSSVLSAVGIISPVQRLVELEWTPTWRLFASDPLFPTFPSLLLVGALIFSFVRLKSRDSLRRGLCALAAFALALSAVRHLLPFGVVALAVIAQNERDRLRASHGLKATGRWTGLFPAMRLAVAAGVVMLTAWYHFSVLTDRFYVEMEVPDVTGVGFYPDTIPEGAVQWLSEYQPVGELFNNYNSGAYLLYRLDPHVRVYTDSRLIDLTRYQEALRAVYDPGAFDELVRRDGIGTVVLLHPSPETVTLLPRLASDSRWRMVFRDANSTIHIRTDLPAPVRRAPSLHLPPVIDPASRKINDFLAGFKRYTLPAAELTDAFVSEVLGDRERRIDAYRRALARAPGNEKASYFLEQLGATSH